MAKPIEFRPTPLGTREKTQERLAAAPVEHAAALLEVYDLLDQLHESGTLSLLKGMLGAGDKIVEEVAAMLVMPEAIRGMRNLILLAKITASINPDALQRIVKTLPQSEQAPSEEKPPSMFSLVRRMFSADSRRGLAVALTAAESLGQATKPQEK